MGLVVYMLFTTPAKGGTVVGVHQVHSDGSRTIVSSNFVPHYKLWHKILALFNRRKVKRLADLSYAKRLEYEIRLNAAFARYLNDLEVWNGEHERLKRSLPRPERVKRRAPTWAEGGSL